MCVSAAAEEKKNCFAVGEEERGHKMGGERETRRVMQLLSGKRGRRQSNIFLSVASGRWARMRREGTSDAAQGPFRGGAKQGEGRSRKARAHHTHRSVGEPLSPPPPPPHKRNERERGAIRRAPNDGARRGERREEKRQRERGRRARRANERERERDTHRHGGGAPHVALPSKQPRRLSSFAGSRCTWRARRAAPRAPCRSPRAARSPRR